MKFLKRVLRFIFNFKMKKIILSQKGMWICVVRMKIYIVDEKQVNFIAYDEVNNRKKTLPYSDIFNIKLY